MICFRLIEIATNSSPASAAEAPATATRRSCHPLGSYPCIWPIICHAQPPHESARKVSNGAVQQNLHESGNATRIRNALCSVVVTPAIGVVAVAALVVLAGSLAGHAETVSYFRPADAQRHCMVDEGR
jgi:hypothetical protein